MVVAAGYDDLFRAAADAAEPFQIPAKALPKNEQPFRRLIEQDIPIFKISQGIV